MLESFKPMHRLRLKFVYRFKHQLLWFVDAHRLNVELEDVLAFAEIDLVRELVVPDALTTRRARRLVSNN